MAEMETEMLAHPVYWQSHHQGVPDDQRVLRHFNYSDRIRYYWASSVPQEAVRRLIDRLTGSGIPEPLISQLLPRLYPRVGSGALDPTARTLELGAVRDVLRVDAKACGATRAAGAAVRLGPAITTPTSRPMPAANDQARTTQQP